MAKEKFWHKNRRETLLRLVVGLMVCLGMLSLYIWQPATLQQADRLIYDVYLRWNGGGTPSPTPALIDLDESSLEEYGQWPWPRHLVARLIANLTEQGAAAIGLDILLSEPDRASINNIQDSFKQHFNLQIDFSNIPQTLRDNDQILASIIQQTPTVLGMYTRFGQEATPLPKDLIRMEGIVERMKTNAIPPRTHILRGSGATLPLPVLRAVAPMGSLNVAPDADGIVRSIPLVSALEDRVIPSLALRSLMRGLGTESIILSSGPDGLEAVRIGKFTIPVTPDGRLMVTFRGGRGTYPTFRAADILKGIVPAEEIQGRIFIVGTSAPGLLDIRATPFDSIYPGAEVHTTVIDAILSQRFIQTPAWIPGAQVCAILFVGVISTVAFSLMPALVYLPLLCLLTGSSYVGGWYIFKHGMYISPLYAILTACCLALSLLAVRFWQEARQKRTLRQAFSRYVTPDMVSRIVEKGEAVLAGEERQVTLIFTDIRGFTSLSEKLSPAQVVGALNQYFTPMTSIIRSSGGTVDKFIGDAIMAFWNAPLDVPRHELQAVMSAIQMQKALSQLNVRLEEELGISFRMGVGVHTGKVYVGNMGSAELLDYTCIGDTVNLTSRLEGLCPVYGVEIVVSSATAKRCTTYAAENATGNLRDIPYFLPLDSIRVKGKSEPVEICTPIPYREASERKEELELFQEARELYIEGNFHEAALLFTTLKTQYPSTLLYSIYEERSQHLMQKTPTSWDGVWTFTKK